jgi:intron-binding protein aquarius
VYTQIGNDCYGGINLLIRRKAKENNFKAVLSTIRVLMNTSAVGRAVPTWLQDIFLGYGDPAAAHYRCVSCTVNGVVNLFLCSNYE